MTRNSTRRFERSQRRIAVVTGTRAEFGLLRTVMHAVRNHPSLDLRTIVTGVHLLHPARTIDEVAAEFTIDAVVEMQREAQTTRGDDARALGRGVCGLADAIDETDPDVLLVLGDRIEAFAAASAGAVAGVRTAHMHGGDRAEGVADESLRHAITKLAHLHLPATVTSAERIIAMGEEPRTVHLVGSPAIDDLGNIDPLDDDQYRHMGKPEIVFLMHPVGRSDDDEYSQASRLLETCARFGNVLAIDPNFDAGREGIVRAIASMNVPRVAHLGRESFIGLMKRVSIIVGNSSAGLIECAPLGVWCINIGSRQAGRERPGNVADIPDEDPGMLDVLLLQRFGADRWSGKHPYGDGRAGRNTAEILADFDPTSHPLRKRNSY